MIERLVSNEGAIMIKKRWWILDIMTIICLLNLPLLVVQANDTSTAEVTFQQSPTTSSSKRQRSTIQNKGASESVAKAQQYSSKAQNSPHYMMTTAQANRWQGRLPQTSEQVCRWLLAILGVLLLGLLLMAGYYNYKCERYQ